ncbi:AAA-domain-containing protein [Epithele typhae]|uniref:AAA-domain-containing protein n=1 Tax=Epithele typhae TaxID=378194 RepID=UPI0020089DC5|nr:AAA-domain-containing protein [Epithele typhae]KAH9946015.1 AAA-domain-containing protein [Epithele typhae]
MRSHLLARRTRSLLKTLPSAHRSSPTLTTPTVLRNPPRKERTSPPSQPRFSRRTLSTPETPPPEDAEEKPKRRGRASSAAPARDADAVALPDGVRTHVLWGPRDDYGASGSPRSEADRAVTLPPPEIFDAALHNLHIVLHPQTQHRSVYVGDGGNGGGGGGGGLVEPTLALYCPIEGGDYIVDETVREMARRTGADVVVLDAVQLAAGECGHFGKAATALQLQNNPLQFASSSARSTSRAASPREPGEEEEEQQSSYGPMTVHVMAAVPRRPLRTAVDGTTRTTESKLKSFFSEVINMPSEAPADQEQARRPRIIYVRDYPTLAPTSSTWYPTLLSAVRQRRQGALSRSDSPVYNPTAIVFGITPSFLVPESPANTPASQGVNVLSSRPAASPSSGSALKSQNEFGEDSNSEKAREKRIQRRLKRWSRGNAEDLPRLAAPVDDGADGDGKGRSGVFVLGQDGFPALPPFLSRVLGGGRGQGDAAGTNSQLGFFRTSLVYPTVRSLTHERESRTARRREINELVMRMGVQQIGGVLGALADAPGAHPSESGEGGEGGAHGPEERARQQLWAQWGRTVEVWPHVQRIADRAVGSVVAQSRTYLPTHPSLEPTPVPWSAVFDAWAADRSSADLWKTLFATPPAGRLPHEAEAEEHTAGEEEADVDEIIEKLRRNPDLDEHEQRLLGCIVDTAFVTTTFSQVHLPDHTIDSVRTMVSLPLLHPSAFQHGILKEHSMTGCLLFGPPGTGKTLVVRALAKEAGCRMLVVSPSDIMDMYVGEGEKLVRAVFSLARRLSPCVVFIDELDALFGARVSRESGSSIAHRGVITEFMQEMDGLKSSKDSNVIVIGATNRPFDLDDAVLRRLPRRLLVDLPGEKEREEILKILLRDETLAHDVDLKRLAKKTESFSGSDLKHLCVSAALDAVKERVTVPWRQAIGLPQNAASTYATAAEETTPAADRRPDDASPTVDALGASAEAVDAPSSSAEPAIAREGQGRTPADTASASTACSSAPDVETADEDSNAAEATAHARSLAWRNFEQALKEITPSASEALGSLSELRKWNDEFGEGRKSKKRQVWGKDRFGFIVSADSAAAAPAHIDPAVSPPVPSQSQHLTTSS